jgi:hypothetical protein
MLRSRSLVLVKMIVVVAYGDSNAEKDPSIAGDFEDE